MVLAAAAATPVRRIPGAALREDVALLRRAFAELHPGVHRYQTAAAWEARLQALERRYPAGATLTDAYAAIAETVAAVRCGHTP